MLYEMWKGNATHRYWKVELSLDWKFNCIWYFDKQMSSLERERERDSHPPVHLYKQVHLVLSHDQQDLMHMNNIDLICRRK